jgi:hypothetical protein
MPSLIHQRCFNHAGREAVARCPACGHFFCRECVTEHDDKIICAGCLAKIAREPPTRRRGLGWVRRVALGLVGFIVAWFFFYILAQGLLQIPVESHENSVWQAH